LAVVASDLGDLLYNATIGGPNVLPDCNNCFIDSINIVSRHQRENANVEIRIRGHWQH